MVVRCLQRESGFAAVHSPAVVNQFGHEENPATFLQVIAPSLVTKISNSEQRVRGDFRMRCGDDITSAETHDLKYG